jgi:hypothetical protein
MHQKKKVHHKTGWMALLGACGAILLAQAVYGAEVFRCSSWTNSSLSHRGLVTVAMDADVLTWRANTTSSTATAIRQGGTFAAYVDDSHIYIVFGALFFDVDLVRAPLTIRRIPFVRNSPRIGEIECE